MKNITTNDDKILELKEHIKVKRASLKEARLFRPATNCSLEFEDGLKCNLRTLTRDRAIKLLVKLNTIMLSVKDLGLEAEYKIGDYLLTDWISDIQLKMEELTYKAEKQKLQALEKKLDSMLSSDKQVELELDSIADLLKI